MEKVNYTAFIASKRREFAGRGIERGYELNPKLKDFQRLCTQFALRRGRAILAEACGLGKTWQELEWGRVVSEHSNGIVLLAAPLAVGRQTAREAKKLDIKVAFARQKQDLKPGINITNYEMLHHFDFSELAGFIGDEISIIKNYAGKIRNQIIESIASVPFRLGASATPSPNDHMELGNYAEFCGVMTRAEMLATYFIHDGGDTSQWRLKGHAEDAFWRWLASWMVCIDKPSDIGCDDAGYVLPPLKDVMHVIEYGEPLSGELFPREASTLQDQRAVKRATVKERVESCAAIANSIKKPWVLWGELNDECDALEAAVPDAVQVAGRDAVEDKESRLDGFSSGKHRVMVSKPSIAGYGLNWQHCAHVGFVNLSHSFEDQYQAIRRCLRFGQTETVEAHYFLSDAEYPILRNIERKRKQAEELAAGMIGHMAASMKSELGATKRAPDVYQPTTKMRIPQWIA